MSLPNPAHVRYLKIFSRVSMVLLNPELVYIEAYYYCCCCCCYIVWFDYKRILRPIIDRLQGYSLNFFF